MKKHKFKNLINKLDKRICSYSRCFFKINDEFKKKILNLKKNLKFIDAKIINKDNLFYDLIIRSLKPSLM